MADQGEEDQDVDNPIHSASNIFSTIIDRTWEKFEQFDQKQNLREMLPYMNHFRNCKTKNDVMEILKYFDPFGETFFTGLAMCGALLDFLLDSIFIVWPFVYGGFDFMFWSSLVILFISTVIGFMRVSFIGKEAYNLRKVMIVGLGYEPDDGLEPYKYEGLLDFWKGKWWSSADEFRTVTSGFISGIRGKIQESWNFISGILQESWNFVSHILRRGVIAQEEIHRDEEINPEDESFPVNDDPEMSNLLQLIDKECLPLLPVLPSFHVITLPLHYSLIKQTWRLHAKLKNDDSWRNKDEVLRIYIQATFLLFIRFHSADLTRAELLSEAVPQLILRTTSLAQRLLKRGFLATSSELHILTKIFLPFSFLFPAIQLVLPTLKVIEYYFTTLGHGADFFNEGGDMERQERAKAGSGVKVMPPYNLWQKCLCVVAHFLTLISVIFTAGFACCSISGPLPLLILFGAFSTTFWRTAQDPTARRISSYNLYNTWAHILSHLRFTRGDFNLISTGKDLCWKLVAFIGANIFIVVILSMESWYFGSTYTIPLLLTIQVTLVILYFVGSVFKFVDRLWVKMSWGSRNFDIYVYEHKS